jgi:hypothetical protein
MLEEVLILDQHVTATAYFFEPRIRATSIVLEAAR